MQHQPTDIGSRLELFVDNHLVDRMTGLHLMMHKPEPKEVILQLSKPWEGQYCASPTVLLVDGQYRLYYRGWPDMPQQASTCIALSDDGIHFDRPTLGMHAFDGDKANNIILTGRQSHNFSPFVDKRPAVPASERFKALAGGVKDGHRGLLTALCSEDGIHWRLMQDEPVITKGAFDSQNVAFWSEPEGCYVSYYRTWTKGYVEKFEGLRTISRATSDDFLNWSDPVQMDFGGAPIHEYYTNQTAPYFRAPHIYLSFAKRFIDGRNPLSQQEADQYKINPKQHTALADSVMFSSRGGNRYDLTFLDSFLRPGRDRRNWTARTNMAALNLVPTADDEISIYYQLHYATPDMYMQRFAMRTDGMASLHAPYAGGEMLTKVVTFTGSALVLNYATSACGSVQIELQEPSGEPIEGFTLDDCPEIFGDEIARTVTWNQNKSLAELVGRPIRIRFVMRAADVYSYQFKSA